MPKHTMPLSFKSEYAGKNDIKYAVYVHYASNENRKSPRWERASHTVDGALALEQAQMLFDSGRFEKVEVKKFSGERDINPRSSTYKIFQNARNGVKDHIILTGFTAALLMAGLIGFIFLKF